MESTQTRPSPDPVLPLVSPACPEAALTEALSTGSAGAVLHAAERARIALGLCRDRARLMAEITEHHARVAAALAPPPPDAPDDSEYHAARIAGLEADLVIAAARIEQLLAHAEMRVVAIWCAPPAPCRALVMGSDGQHELETGDVLASGETVAEITETGVRVRDLRSLASMPVAPDNFEGLAE